MIHDLKLCSLFESWHFRVLFMLSQIIFSQSSEGTLRISRFAPVLVKSYILLLNAIIIANKISLDSVYCIDYHLYGCVLKFLPV